MNSLKLNTFFRFMLLMFLSGILGISCVKKTDHLQDWKGEISFPVINFTYTPFANGTDDTISFKAIEEKGSSSISDWQWSFGDGDQSTASGAEVSFSYSAGGTYDVTLTGTDANGHSARVIKHLTIQGTSTKAPDSYTFKVMVYCAKPVNNAAYKEETYQEMADIINSYSPDFVVLRQIDSTTNRSHQVNMPELIGQKTGMNAFYANAFDYQGGGYGNAVLSKFPIISSRSVALQPAPAKSSDPVKSMAVITAKVDDYTNIIFAGAEIDNKSYNDNRLSQAGDIISALISELQKGNYPVIFGGDLNTFKEDADPDNSPTFQKFLTFFTPAKTSSDYPFNNPVANPSKTADYILYTEPDHFETISIEALPETTASAYLPIMAELKYTP